MLTTSYWPADTSVPILERTVGEILREAAASVSEQIALVTGTPQMADRRHWTYAQMLEESERVARALLSRFQPGERVAVWAPGLAEWVLLEFGAALARVVLVTVNPAFRPKELAYVLQQSGASGIFLVSEFRSNQMAASLEQIRPNLPRLREVISFPDWGDFLASSSPIRARSRKLYYGIGSFAMNYRASLPIRMSEVCDDCCALSGSAAQTPE